MNKTEYEDFLQQIVHQGQKLQELAENNKKEESIAIRDKIRQQIIAHSSNLDQEVANLLLQYLENVINFHAQLLDSKNINESIRDTAIEGALWDIQQQAKIINALKHKTLADIIQLYNLSKMFFVVRDNKELNDLANTLRATANIELEKYSTESHSEKSQIVEYLTEKIDRITEVLPSLKDESVIKDKYNTLSFCLRIIFKYRVDYKAETKSFSEACKNHFTRIHGYFELERKTHIAHYYNLGCQIRACLKAQILTSADKLNSEERSRLKKILSDRIDWLNMRISQGAEKEGGMKEIAFAQYAIETF
ncbi:MAG: hypothetical protein JSR85_04540 [Proteobacteria bacterium]|nr:hypothetical protein [Pseudomonadota bacterium]